MPEGAFIDRNRQLKAVNDVWFVCLHCKDMFPNKKMTGNLCHRFLSMVSDYNCVCLDRLDIRIQRSSQMITSGDLRQCALYDIGKIIQFLAV